MPATIHGAPLFVTAKYFRGPRRPESSRASIRIRRDVDKSSGILRDGACYPSGYGARGCRAYDNSEFAGGDAPIECQAETPPTWCTDLWCYVAPWQCEKPHYESKFFAGATMANATLLAAADSSDSTALTYSYETCGNVDGFTYEEGLTKDISEIAARGPLRIAIPGNEPPYIATVKPGQAHVEGTRCATGASRASSRSCSTRSASRGSR